MLKILLDLSLKGKCLLQSWCLLPPGGQNLLCIICISSHYSLVIGNTISGYLGQVFAGSIAYPVITGWEAWPHPAQDPIIHTHSQRFIPYKGTLQSSHSGGWSFGRSRPWPFVNSSVTVLSRAGLQLFLGKLCLRQEYTLERIPVCHKAPCIDTFIHRSKLA